MAADLSGAWNSVNSIASNVSRTKQQLRQVEASIPTAESEVNSAQAELNAAVSYLYSIPYPSYSEDDDGGQAASLERMRAEAEAAVSSAQNHLNAAESKLENLRSEERSLNNALFSLRSSAAQMAEDYSAKQQEFAQRVSPLKTQSANFQAISGLKFGKSAANAGKQLTDQRAAHYQSLSNAYDELAQASRAAMEGNHIGGAHTQIADRGTYNASAVAAPVRASSSNNASGRTSSGGTASGVSAVNASADAINSSAQAVLTASHSTAVPAAAAGIASVSAASVTYNNSNGNDALSAMSGKFGMNEDELNSFMSENGLCIASVDGSNTAELVPQSAVQASSESASILNDGQAYCGRKGASFETVGEFAPNMPNPYAEKWANAFPNAEADMEGWQELADNPPPFAGNTAAAVSSVSAAPKITPKFENFRYTQTGKNDFLLTGKNTERYREFQNQSHPYSSYGSHVDKVISPELIEGINLTENDVSKPEIFWTQHDSNGSENTFLAIAARIPEVQAQRNAGKSIEAIKQEHPELNECARIYFEDAVRVVKIDDYYEFQDNGRHRIMAARKLGFDIPVKIIGEYK